MHGLSNASFGIGPFGRSFAGMVHPSSTCVPSLETKVSTHFRLTAVKPPRLTRITSLLLGLAFPTGPNRDQSLLPRGNIAISPEAREAQHRRIAPRAYVDRVLRNLTDFWWDYWWTAMSTQGRLRKGSNGVRRSETWCVGQDQDARAADRMFVR